MATKFRHQAPLLHLLSLLLFLLFLSSQGYSERQEKIFNLQGNPKDNNNNDSSVKSDSRRVMIGSTRPTCTFNECRGCKFRCIAEQVPVEGNDPMNSAYHYKCVCHR